MADRQSSSRLSPFVVTDEGWVVCPYAEGELDGWADAVEPTHASLFTTAWESKCGGSFRISHVREQLGSHPIPGSMYGNIVVSFKKPAILPGAATATTSTTIEMAGTAEAEHLAKIDSVVNPLKASFSLDDKFTANFQAWKATWFSPAMGARQRYCFGRCSYHARLVT
jgi:hypothetical protein